jgi:hypothetical protein
MVNIDPVTVSILGTVTIAGILLTVAGYDLAATVLNVVGWVGGGVIGGAVGWVGLPRIAATGGFETPQLLGMTAFLVIFSAILGAGLIRLFTQFTAGFAGFTAGAAAVFFTLTGQELNTTASAVATTGLEDSPLAVLDLFQFSALSQEILIQTLGIAAVVGIITGVIAMRNYYILMTICLSVLGAALLASTTSLWIQLIQRGSVSFAQQGEFSLPVAIGAFGTGLVVQYIRHRDTDPPAPLGEDSKYLEDESTYWKNK